MLYRPSAGNRLASRWGLIRMKTSLVALTVLVLLVITAAVSSRDTAEASDAWPGPDGVTAADGLSPGEAVLTWSMVEKAAYYRIGWVAGSEYQARADGGADWQEGFVFTDVPNRGQASHLVTGLTPGGEYHFVVASHDGRIPTLQPPHEFASFRLADIPATSGNHPGQVRLEGPWRTDFPELWLNICRPDNSGGGRYCVTVPTGYVDFDETAEWIEGIREGAFFGLSGNLTDVEDRARFYRDMLLEMVIQPGTRGDVFRGEVLADFPETARATIELAEIVSESVEAFTELADSELFKAHLEHLDAHGFFLGAKLGTHLVDVAIAAAANRTIEIEEARKRLGLLEQDIRKAMPNDLAWEAAFGMVWQELEDMDNPDAMTRWSNALSDNLDEIALTISKFLVAHAAKTAAVAGAKAAATALGATVSIPAAPITLTVGLAVWVVYYVIEETDQFWDELILSSTALQVYLAMTSIKREEDDHNILDYATFTFYQHLLNAMDTSVWIFNFDEQQLKSNRLPVTKSRDQALKQIIDIGWDPSRDIDVAEVGHLTNSALPRGAWAHGEDLWIMTWGPSTTGSGFTTNIDAYDLATRAPTDANVFSSATRSLHGMWSRGTTVWISHDGLLGGSLQAYSLSGSTGMLVRAEQHDFSTLSDAGNAAPRGIWSNHETMWVSDSSDKKVYAYRMDSRQRDPEKDLDGLKAAGNDSPGGIWSDGTTMWVVDRDDARVYAYGIATGRRDPARDIELLNIPDAVGNTDPVDIWSNGNIMWVVDEQGLKLFAYQLPPKVTSTPAAIPFQSNPSLDLNRLNLAENHEAEGIWSNGNTMWVADQDDDRVYAYGMSDGARVPSQEVNLQTQLVGGNTDATGIWSDETTMWVADHHDDRIYAYRLSGGARVEDEEYDLNQPSVHSEYATGIWFDSTNGRMWVADRLVGKIHGFDANSKELVGTIDTLDCAGNRDPQGIWSDGTTMWVADNDDDRIYAYSIGDNLRDPGKEFNTLKAANNNDARGIWSDGRTTMWVADQDKNWIYAYNMPELFLSTPAPAVLGNPSQLVVGPAGLHGVVTLNWRPAANANIHRIYLTNADGTESRYWDFDLCGDANTAMIGLRHRDQEYRFRVIAGLRGTDGNIQWSDGSEWSYPILGDGFSSATIPSLGNPTSLAAAPGSQSGEVALRWSPAANATVQWVYLVKPDGTDGRYWPHALAGDAATLTVTGLDAGETYLFLVIAGQEQADGTPLWSQWSNWARGTPTSGMVLTETQLSISSDGSHTCALKVDGSAVCWGRNSHGQATPPVGETFATISSGGWHTCGLRADGSGVVICWGGRNEDRPVTPPAGETFAAISSGSHHTCGLRVDGSAVCWGWNRGGQASPPNGEVFTAISSGGFHTCGLRADGSPVCWGHFLGGETMPPMGETFATISSGSHHVCGLRADGSAVCWGRNVNGETTLPTGNTFAAISSGAYHTCGLRADGSAVCWGYNEYGQATPPVGETFAAISSGYFHTCGLRADGSVVCWGRNDYGQATPAAGEVFAVNLSIRQEQDTSQVQMSISGGWHTCALRPDGVTRCWGLNDFGQATPPIGEKFSTIHTRHVHTCGLRADGSAVCWGYNGYGQSTPPAGETFTAITSSDWHTCGLRTNGSVICWGYDVDGRASVPTGESFTMISAGYAHTCGLRASGTVRCWGRHDYGQSTPPAGQTFPTIHSGYWHTCGLTDDGLPQCWGRNDYGQSTPPTGESLTVISGGGYHTCGLTINGSARCWGRNTDGQATPPAGETFAFISSGYRHTCGLRSNGTATCWGDNRYGQASPPEG